ncbi:DEAD/DEAH box helicase [Sporosarcina sp. CAU 1771]
MNQISSSRKILKCGLGLTDNARKGIAKIAKDEHAFFSVQDAFTIHIEKRPVNNRGNMSFTFFFDNDKNEKLSKNLNNRVAVMECIYQHDGFLATGFHVRGRREIVRTNRRLPVRLKFQLGTSTGATMPIELYTSLRELPIAEERSEYVKKRLTSWEGYLGIQERNADVADVSTSFSESGFNKDFSKLRLNCKGLTDKELHTIKGFSAKIGGIQSDIGKVVGTNRAKKSIEIELNPKYKEMARRNELHLRSYKEIIFSNFAELSQVKRLRKGFKDLQDGLAANSNLEKILFEERPVVRISKKKADLEFHNTLNEFQQEAVAGAMNANDLYVIQGPPGTGKTTVISEICHQNVKAGLRTLVASQANLAVDNALGRLLSHQDIRILRYGRTDSIEEEGKKFIEENVALNWKEQVVDAVGQQLNVHSAKEKNLNDDLSHSEHQIEHLQTELSKLEEKIKLHKKAQTESRILSGELKKLNSKRTLLQEEQDKTISSQEVTMKLVRELNIELEQLEQVKMLHKITPQTHEQMEYLAQENELIRKEIEYLHFVQVVTETETSVDNRTEQLQRKLARNEQLKAFLQSIIDASKWSLLKEKMDAFEITPNSSLQNQIAHFEQIIKNIASDTSPGMYHEWKKVNDRLEAAVKLIEQLLKDRGFSTNLIKRNANQKYNTVDEINGLIDRVGQYLVKPSTKKLLALRTYSAEKYDCLEQIAIALALLQERRSYAKYQGAQFVKEHQIQLDAIDKFATIKAEVTLFVKHLIEENDIEKSTLTEELEKLQRDLASQQQQCAILRKGFVTLDENRTIYDLQGKLEIKEQVYRNYEEKKEAYEQTLITLKEKENRHEIAIQKLDEIVTRLESNDNEKVSINQQCVETESQLTVLEEILVDNPEGQYERTLELFYSSTKNVEQLQIELERLPIINGLQEEWFSLLGSANEYDLDEIRKLYVQHANVIGTTCVASARRDFMEEYPTFDVVIIDEVSKATPPELLLPMLKGKKVILVGDHHQLPPLIGQETMEEFLEEIENQVERKEFEKLLNESLFERLFRTLPRQNKTMLGIQYRMHESIMQTIAPFYEDGDYRLKCGLTDSDAMRDHQIDSKFIQKTNHLLWFDMPNQPQYFEEKVKGGTSRYNEAELTMTKQILLDLEVAMEKAKREGTMNLEEKKSVGVISFYGEQVKRIDRMIEQDIAPEHLHCRTGSVDKFQGMEMDIIILSFVRNHQEKSGDIGFAKDYRRLNVALSRARELLIIVGSSEMFTVRTKHEGSKEMYGRLLDVVKEQNGFRDEVGNLKL